MPPTTRKRATPAKTASPRTRSTATKNSDTPEPLGIDLDAVVYDGPAGPYPFKLNGVRYTLSSPVELDVNVLGDIARDPMLFLSSALSGPEYERLAKSKLPLHKLQALLAGYMGHYDLGNFNASVS